MKNKAGTWDMSHVPAPSNSDHPIRLRLNSVTRSREVVAVEVDTCRRALDDLVRLSERDSRSERTTGCLDDVVGTQDVQSRVEPELRRQRVGRVERATADLNDAVLAQEVGPDVPGTSDGGDAVGAENGERAHTRTLCDSRRVVAEVGRDGTNTG